MSICDIFSMTSHGVTEIAGNQDHSHGELAYFSPAHGWVQLVIVSIVSVVDSLKRLGGSRALSGIEEAERAGKELLVDTQMFAQDGL